MTFAIAGALPPGTVLTDPVLPLLHLLTYAGATAALTLGMGWLSLWRLRERMIRQAVKRDPRNADEIRRAVRSVPVLSLWRRPDPPPSDPYALTHRVVVWPLGDGRPGESFRAPGPNVAAGPLGTDGQRQDVRVVLAPRTHLLVVCLGRVGPRDGGDAVEPAAERVHAARAHYTAPQAAIGPVDRVDTPAGVGWRTTCTFGGASTLTDTHVDHDGWAFVVGVLSYSWHARAVDVADRILASWQWIPADAELARWTPSGG
ncbi:hypothetical protein [Cellulomonas sp.]|uniref:hypothetical protein n=1 Tax=Cellulomonas sp. TaxID=40001 RepID=UPI001B2B16A5|nr:hypothetical protein [Cellulomonas sp.]MBO9556302.1 hypothetical protein [Cellulomonas sp.]